MPPSLCIWHKKRLLTKAGAYRGGVLGAGRCLVAEMAVLEGIGRHPMVGEPAMQWVDFLTFRGRQEKSPDSCESGLLFGAGEMNRTPDLLITNDGIGVFAPVDWCC